MKKIKNFIKSNIISLGILLILIIILISYVIISNKEVKELKENIYTAYVEIGSLIKINLKEKYYECTNKKVTKICSEKTIEITGYELLDESTNSLYKDIEFSNLDIYDLLIKLTDISISNNSFSKIKIISDYKFDNNKLKELFKNSYEISYEEDLNEEDILKYFLENTNYYTITFETDGGNTIDSIIVKENETIEKPENPVKEGFKFIKWQLNEQDYDFNKEIKEDIVLTAKWEKIEEVKKPSVPTQSPTTSSSLKNDLINLNDNIIVSQRYSTILCGFGIFATNLQEVFPKAKITGNIGSFYPEEKDATEEEIPLDALIRNMNKIKIDSSKEKIAIDLLEKTKNNLNNYTGIKNFEYKVTDHRIEYSYYYLDILDGSFKTDGMNINKSIKNAFSSAIALYGQCGGNFSNNEYLTEKLCEEYNLKCSRW